ncbi:MAG: hypothetical protein LLG05_02460 [Porphyromonadaceae bacterium]|nr:hypothetical protein [Porphyromonadaceae bacterium]
MSSRRNFLRNLGGLFAVSLFSPSLLKALERSEGIDSTIKLKEDTTLKTLSGSLDMLTTEDREWTEAFFKYLKNHNVGFKWERVYSPVFETKVGRLFQVESRATGVLYNPMWENGIFEVRMQSFSGGTTSFYNPETIEAYREKLFTEICASIAKRKRERVYLYQLTVAPSIINPMTFETGRHLITRGVEI